jgi:hypothetical protein
MKNMLTCIVRCWLTAPAPAFAAARNAKSPGPTVERAVAAEQELARAAVGQ